MGISVGKTLKKYIFADISAKVSRGKVIQTMGIYVGRHKKNYFYAEIFAKVSRVKVIQTMGISVRKTFFFC